MNGLAFVCPAGAVRRGTTRRCIAQTLLLALVGTLSAPPCRAYDVLLRWTVSSSPGIAGYRVYHGSASRNYGVPVDAGRLDHSTLSGVVYYLDQNHQPGNADYIAVTAYNSAGESDYSNEKMFNLTSAAPPSVDAGPDQTVSVGSVVTLGSVPTNGLAYFWEQTTGPPTTLQNRNSSRAQFTPLTPGTYGFALTAANGDGVAASDLVTIIAVAPVTVTPTVTVTRTPTLTPTATATPSASGGLSNDACINAAVVDGASYSRTAVTSSATTEATDPAVGCGNGSRGKSVWYRFTAPSDGALVANTFGSNYDTILAAYRGSCGALAAVPGACNDDTSGTQSRVSFTASAGTTYYFLVSAYANNGGALVFQLTFQGLSPTAISSPTSTRLLAASTRTQVPSSTPTLASGRSTPTFTPRQPTPVNDACDSAVVASQSYSGTVPTGLATSDATDPVPACGNGSRSRSVWYRFTAPSNGALTADTFGSNYDTILSAYAGTCGAFAPVLGACNDDTNGRQSRISFTATAGVTYYFLVSSYDNIGGSLTFRLGFQGSGSAPATPVPTRTEPPPAGLDPVPSTPTFTPTSTPASSLWNDACANARPIDAVPFAGTVVTTAATTEAADPAPACGNNSRAKSVWYRFTTSTTGTLTADTFGSTYDTILAVYAGSCGGFTPLPRGCNDDTNGQQSRVSFQGNAGVTYYFMVTAYANNGGTLNFRVSY